MNRRDHPMRFPGAPQRGAQRSGAVQTRDRFAAAAAWPLAARAQQMPVIGYLGSLSPNADAGRLSALRQSLAAAGYSEGTSLAIENRWAEGDYDRLAAHSAEFVRRDVAVIFAAALPSALAANAATSSITFV